LAAFLRDLKEALQTFQQDNVMMIIGGDFNESNRNLGLHYILATELGLQYIWDQQEIPETHWRGSQCIDHIYMSQEMMECINTMEYLDYPKELYTDHCPIEILLDLSSLE
jgi:exonuclease III